MYLHYGKAECGIANCDRPEVEMTSETSGLGGFRLEHVSPLVFTGHFSDLDSSLNVTSISLCICIMFEAEANFTSVILAWLGYNRRCRGAQGAPKVPEV